MHGIPKRRREQPDPVPAFPKKFIRFLEHGHAGPLRIPRINRHILFFDQDLQPIVKPPDHDRAHRPHARNFLAFFFAPLQTALHRLCNRNALRESKAHRRVDADSAVCRLFDCRYPRRRHRNLHDHVWRQPAELFRLRHNALRIAIQSRVSLNRQPPVFPALRIKNRFQQSSRPHGNFPHHLPRNFIFRCRRKFLQ